MGKVRILDRAKILNLALIIARDEIRSLASGLDYALDKPQMPENARRLQNAIVVLDALDDSFDNVIERTFDFLKIINPESANIDPDIRKPNYREKKRIVQSHVESYAGNIGLNIKKINAFVNGQYSRGKASIENHKNIALFIKGNILIHLCFYSNPNLSPFIREKILNEMLMPKQG